MSLQRGRVTLGAIQRGLETLYRVETGVDVGDFVIDEVTRDAACPERKAREQLLVADDGSGGSGAALALFLDELALGNLCGDPDLMFSQKLGDTLLAVEGVSHFVYTVVCANADRQLSALELEVQAEVDKYATCLLATSPTVAISELWRQRLFVACEYDDALDAAERERYQVANDNAYHYTGYLQRAFVSLGKIPEMLSELRRYYRAGLPAKLAAAKLATR